MSQSRSLDSLEFFGKIAQTVTIVLDELQRVKNSAEIQQILDVGQDAVHTVTDAAAHVTDDIQTVIVLALQVYEKSLLRTRNLIQVTDLNAVSDRHALVDQILVRI